MQFLTLVRRLLALTVPLLLLASPAADAIKEGQSNAQQSVLEVFVRDGCPHCAEAKLFLSGFGAERPWLQIVYRSVDHDPAARDELTRHFEDKGIWPPGVPTFVMNGKVLVGFVTRSPVAHCLKPWSIKLRRTLGKCRQGCLERLAHLN